MQPRHQSEYLTHTIGVWRTLVRTQIPAPTGERRLELSSTRGLVPLGTELMREQILVTVLVG